jgi:hypothetical protein
VVGFSENFPIIRAIGKMDNLRWCGKACWRFVSLEGLNGRCWKRKESAKMIFQTSELDHCFSGEGFLCGVGACYGFGKNHFIV